MKAYRRAIALLGVSACTVALGWFGGTAIASGRSEPQAQSANTGAARAHVYDRTSTGLTYGSLADSAYVGNEPDLVAVELEDGTDGYVYWNDLNELEGGNISTPEEAVAWERNRALRGDSTLPVYDADGRVVIGSWAGVYGEGHEDKDIAYRDRSLGTR